MPDLFAGLSRYQRAALLPLLLLALAVTAAIPPLPPG